WQSFTNFASRILPAAAYANRHDQEAPRLRFEVEKSAEGGEKRRTAIAIKPPGPLHCGKLLILV
ncbi:hypothetical protein AB4142_33285, partial [Variovorax sp. 2RAF20]